MAIGTLLAPIGRQFAYLTNYKYNIEMMRTQIERLKHKKFEVQQQVDEATRIAEIVDPDVEGWMMKVCENEERVYEIWEGAKLVGRGCLNLKSRYRMSRIAIKITQDIVELLNEGQFDRTTYNRTPSSREHIPSIEVETLVLEDQGDGFLDVAYVCRRFTFAEIQSATHNFKDAFVIGKGGFGKVYKGFVDNEATAVAIKRLDPMSNQGDTEFRTEIEMLSKFRHCNLVSLIGYCYDGRERILVYEYMLNGSVADHLHPKDGRNCNSFILSWVQRLKICIGAARGIDYLHTGTGVLQRVIHRDVKTSNILLDENWAAKVSDFGLCKIGPANQSITHVSTCVKGTPGYCDPEYFLTHRLTKKSDVYAFGVVLFEVLSGKPALDFRLPKEQRSLVAWAQQCIRENTIHYLIDPNLKWEICSNSLKAFVEIANQCLHNDSKKRPKIAEVVASLELALTLQMSKDSSLLEEDIFGFAGTYNIDEQDLQNQVGSVDDGYKDWLKLEDSEGGRKVETETNDDDDGTSTKNISSNRWCKNCRKVESCVLLLPCRHLCLCTMCNSSLQVCPICNSTKNASVQINMSICATYDIDDQCLQNQVGSVDDGYKEWLKLEDSEGGRKVDTETNDNDDDGTSAKNISRNRWCKICGKVESCILLLPCKHLCLCTMCDSSLHACPICNSFKFTSLPINMSICATYDIDDQCLQNQGGSVNNGYKEWLKSEDSEGGRKVETEPNDNVDGTSTRNISSNRWCKNCGKVESCVLLLPCRHLCLCTTCESSLHACPICNSIKTASVQINMSS